uniref:ATP synthase F0 subunit 6 n=1 Tax=Paraschizogynium plumachela TaxID=3109024 RepID=UPI002E76D062|nr:ATP synthase F0 subunit 6 [Paraschizogynium plumachela]WQM21754.1 ATP synthase F0 subunit 6 [Paraschizogynium plumachela]
MTNLFSIFDPSSSNYFSLNWISLFLLFMYTPPIYWTIPSRISIMFNILFSSINKEIYNNINKSNLKTLIMFFSMFWFIMMNNLLGLYPYIFTATSHISITVSLALPMWLLFMIYGWMNMTSHMFTHLVPLGTPLMLSSFMVLIESVSNIIRPLTLAVRLAANMVAGHLLLSLLSNIYEKILFSFILSFPILIALLILEYAVAMIQSYVFITLLSLYLTEIN